MRGTGACSNTVQWVQRVKKTQFTDAKIFTDANLRTQQKQQYTQVYLCAYVQNITPRERCI